MVPRRARIQSVQMVVLLNSRLESNKGEEESLGFGAWGLRFGDGDLGFGIWGLGFGDWDLEIGIWGLGIWGWGSIVGG